MRVFLKALSLKIGARKCAPSRKGSDVTATPPLMEVLVVTYFKAALIVLLGWSVATVQAAAPTNEELDAAWTAEDDARAAAQRVPASPVRLSVDPLGDLTDRAELIIHGTVTMQDFVYDGDDSPFTRTTLTVIDVLKGDFTGDQFILLQEGGVEREDSNIVVTESKSRFFAVGDEELLLLGPETGISGQTRGASFDSDPSLRSMVREVQTRSRIFGGKVYDEDGRGIFLESLDGGGHRLTVSHDRHPAPQFTEIRIGPHTFTKFISSDHADDGGLDGNTPAKQAATPSYADGTDASSLIVAIRQ